MAVVEEEVVEVQGSYPLYKKSLMMEVCVFVCVCVCVCAYVYLVGH